MAENPFSHLIRLFLLSPVAGAVLGALGEALYPRDHPNWLDVNPLRLNLPRLPGAFHGYRLVQISDFHIGTWLTSRRLGEAVERVNRLNPDLVAITGDFVTYHPDRFRDDLVRPLRALRARDGVVAVLGNHDHWSDAAEVRRILAAAGVRDLSNTVFTLLRGGDCLHIAGVDDHMSGLSRLDQVLEKLPAVGGAILLAHEPDFADLSAASGRFDLQLSGHTHGGQIRLPRLGAIFLPRYGRKYPSGLYQVGDMLQYTNRGLGTAEILIRLNCPAEITVFTLESPAASQKVVD